MDRRGCRLGEDEPSNLLPGVKSSARSTVVLKYDGSAPLFGAKEGVQS